MKGKVFLLSLLLILLFSFSSCNKKDSNTNARMPIRSTTSSNSSNSWSNDTPNTNTTSRSNPQGSLPASTSRGDYSTDPYSQPSSRSNSNFDDNSQSQSGGQEYIKTAPTSSGRPQARSFSTMDSSELQSALDEIYSSPAETSEPKKRSVKDLSLTPIEDMYSSEAEVDVEEREADVPTFNPNDLFFYVTICDDSKTNPRYKVLDSLNNYNIDPDKAYNLEEILDLYLDDTQGLPERKTEFPTLIELQKQNSIISASFNDNVIKTSTNSFKIDLERQRRRDTILASGNYYKISIINAGRGGAQGNLRKSMSMMALDKYISSVNRLELSEEEEIALAGGVVNKALPIEIGLSIMPYTYAHLLSMDSGKWVDPRYTFQTGVRGHYKFVNNKDFMISGGLKFGVIQSFLDYAYNIPVFAEVGVAVDRFDVYAGLGVISSDLTYGIVSLGLEAEGVYNLFFGRHSSFYFGLNLTAGVSFGELVSGKKVELSKIFASPVMGYKFSLDPVRNDKVIEYKNLDYYEIRILDPSDKVNNVFEQLTQTSSKYFVEVQYDGAPFDLNVFGSPYSLSFFIENNVPKVPQYAFNFGVSGHYKIITTNEKSIGVGLRLDFNQSFNRVISLIPILIDANLCLLDYNVDAHAGIGVSLTHRIFGGSALAVKAGASYNLPLTKYLFFTAGADLDLNLKTRFKFRKPEISDIIAITHFQLDPFVGLKYSFDKFERLIFDSETGYSTEDAYIIDILNDVAPKTKDDFDIGEQNE